MDGVQTGAAGELGIDVDAIAAFYAKHWPREIALGLPKFAHWQFVAPPEQHERCTVCVSVLDGLLIGAMGLNERLFHLDGVARPAAELTTWIVAPEAKGKGIGPRMIDHLQARYDVLLGSGISDEALNVYLRKGFNYWRAIPRYFRILDFAAAAPFSEVTALGRKLAMQRAAQTHSAPHGATRIAACEANDAAIVGCHRYARDAATLAWRYDNHPVYDYETYAIDGGAFIILRRDEIPGMRFAHVVELMAPLEVMPAVLAFLDEYGREHGLAAIDCTCVASHLGGALVAGGWFSSVDEPMFAFLNLFHPPELREPQTTSVIYWAKNAQTSLADTGRLYFVKGDLDLDRPTISYYEARGIEPR